MAKSILVNYDFNKNQILNVVIQVLASAPGSPAEGQVYYNSTDGTFYGWDGSGWLDLGPSGGGGATNLTFSRDGTTVTVISDTGTDAILPTADTTNAGVMSAALWDKLDGIEALADVTDATNVDAAGATMNSDTSLAGNGYFLDDDTMAANDATKVVSQQSLVAYVNAQIASAITTGMDYKGAYNASTNTPALDTGSPSISIGDTYAVTVAGTFFTTEVEVGDILIANNTSADAATAADWDIVQANLTPASIKSQYESNADTNAFTDAEQTLLGNQSGVNTGDEVQATESLAGIAEIATQTETNTGTDDTRIVTPLKLATYLGTDDANLNSAVRYTQQIGNGASTNIVVTHNIGRQFVTAQVFETSSPFAQIECDVEMDSTTQTSFTFNTAPTSNQYTVVIVG